MAFFNNLGSFLNAAGGAVNLGAAAFDVYRGVSNYSQARRYQNQLARAARQQAAFTAEQQQRIRNLHFPLQEAQARRALEDFQATEGLSRAQRTRAIERGLADIQIDRELDPRFRQAQRDVINRLTEGPERLQERFRSEATADIQRSFGQVAEQQERRLAAAGVNPQSGAFAGAAERTGLQQALALAGGRTAATRAAEVDALNRQQQALNARAGIPFRAQQAPSFNPAAVAQGLATAASTSGAAAGQFGQAAQQQLAGGVYAFNRGIQSFGQQRTNRGVRR